MVAQLSIVLVEDNDDLRELTAAALRAEGHAVVALSCAEELEDTARGAIADVFLIDLNLPGEDGFSLSRRIRQVQPLVGIIIISARTDLQDKVVGYDCGADWYLSKPVPFAELSAALKSFARRRQAQSLGTAPAGSLLRLQKNDLHGRSSCVRLSSSEVRLLTAFARAPSGRLENWQISELLNIDLDDSNKSVIEVRITRLRKKLTQVGAESHCLESLRSIGYQLNAPVQLGA